MYHFRATLWVWWHNRSIVRVVFPARESTILKNSSFLCRSVACPATNCAIFFIFRSFMTETHTEGGGGEYITIKRDRNVPVIDWFWQLIIFFCWTAGALPMTNGEMVWFVLHSPTIQLLISGRTWGLVWSPVDDLRKVRRVLYCPGVFGQFLDPPVNHPRGAIFPTVDSINQSSVDFHCEPFGWLIDWR